MCRPRLFQREKPFKQPLSNLLFTSSTEARSVNFAIILLSEIGMGERRYFSSLNITKWVKLQKILFIPQNNSEIDQVVLIRDELTRLDTSINSIALNKALSRYLNKANLQYRNIEKYHTQNTVKIIKYEQPDLVFINPISLSPFAVSFTNAAAYLGIQCLHIYHGSITLYTTHGINSVFQNISVLIKGMIGFCCSLNNFLSIIYLVKTIENTSNYIDFHNILFRELLKMRSPYIESHKYRKGTNLIVTDRSTKEIMVNLNWPEDSVFVQKDLKLEEILPLLFTQR